MKRKMAIALAMLAAASVQAEVPVELLQGGAAGASSPPAQPSDVANDYGTPRFWASVDSFAMAPETSGFITNRSSSSGLYCSGASTHSRAVGQLQIPHGVHFDLFRAWGFDNSAANDLNVKVQSACLPDYSGALTTVTPLGTVTSSGSSGGWSDSAVVPGDVTVDNQSCTYQVIVQLGPNSATCDTSLFFYKVRAQWFRRTPPAPATASFNDVPTTDPFFQVIEALSRTGITAGCGGGNFCPAAPVSRAAMAAFLARALGLPLNEPIVDPANP